jgi:hypothetical protein
MSGPFLPTFLQLRYSPLVAVAVAQADAVVIGTAAVVAAAAVPL